MPRVSVLANSDVRLAKVWDSSGGGKFPNFFAIEVAITMCIWNVFKFMTLDILGYIAG